jgi:UDP-glucose 4-epimerase
MFTLVDKNVLVTGGAGFIGSHLCDSLLKEPLKKLIAADNLYLGKEENLAEAVTDGRFSFENIDITDFEKINRLIISENIEVIFHLAVIPLEASIDNPIWCFDQNVDMTKNILETIRLDKPDICLIAYSSSEVYGTALKLPMDEEHPMYAHTPYAASKAASDLLVYSYMKTFGIDASIVRPFNNYGPRQNEGSYAGIIPITIKRILNSEAPIIFDDGEQTRDFIYVKETADWTVEIYKSGKTRGEFINLASGMQISVNKVINAICKELDYKGEIEYKAKRAGDVRAHEGGVKVAENLFEFALKTQFEEGIVPTINWYKKNIPDNR